MCVMCVLCVGEPLQPMMGARVDGSSLFAKTGGLL